MEIAAPARRVQEAQARWNANGGAGSDCEEIVAQVEEKERQAAELARLRREAEARQAREAEPARLAEAERARLREELQADLAKWQKVVSSEHGALLTGEAWAALLRKWQVTGIAQGDVAGLMAPLGLGPAHPASGGVDQNVPSPRAPWASAVDSDQYGA